MTPAVVRDRRSACALARAASARTTQAAVRGLLPCYNYEAEEIDRVSSSSPIRQAGGDFGVQCRLMMDARWAHLDFTH
jgi:hypothetical protein